MYDLEALVADRSLSNTDITAMTGLPLEEVRECRCRVLSRLKKKAPAKKTWTNPDIPEFRHIDPKIIRDTSLTISEAAKAANVPVATMRKCRITAGIHQPRRAPAYWSDDEVALLELDVTDATLALYIDRTPMAINQKRAISGRERGKTENPYHIKYLKNLTNAQVPAHVAANCLNISVEFVEKRREKIAAQSCEEE